MKITYNGRNHVISSDTWEKYIKTAMRSLEYVSIEDWNKEEIETLARDTWLEDEGYKQNQEQEELVKKTVGQRLKVDKNPEKPKKTTTKSKKTDADKVKIIQLVKEMLENQEEITDLVVENNQKLIVFKLNNQEFKLNLTKTRAKKA